MKVEIIIVFVLISFTTSAQFVISTTTTYLGKAYYVFDVRYVVEDK